MGRDKTEWVAVEAWGPLAEAAAASGLGAGDRVRGIGKLRCNEYSDRATGQKRRSIKVTLESLARVHDGPPGAGDFAAAAPGMGGSEWGDQSQLPPGEWAPSVGNFAAAAPAPPPPSSLPSWPAPDAGVDWNAAAVVPETPAEWGAAAAASAEPAWGAAPAAPAASPEGGLAPWDSESPESWGGPSAVPAAPQQFQQQQQPYQQQQQPYQQQQQQGGFAQQGGAAQGGAQMTGEQKWALFFGDPSAFWDNRLSKRAPRAPDFKHKTSGEGLWIGSRDTPAWVEGRLGELPPPRPGKF